MEIPEKVMEWLKKAKGSALRAFLLLKNSLKHEYSSRGLVFLFILALSVGAFTKSLVNDSLTIGFDDYKLSRDPNIVDLNLLEKSMIQKKDTTMNERSVPKGESCVEEWR